MTKYETIQNVIDNMTDSELIKLHNSYCDTNCYTDDFIYSMSEFDDIEDGRTPSEVAGDICSDFSINDRYFYSDCYGLHSFNYAGDAVNNVIFIHDIIRYMINSYDYLENDDIIDAVDELEATAGGYVATVGFIRTVRPDDHDIAYFLTNQDGETVRTFSRYDNKEDIAEYCGTYSEDPENKDLILWAAVDDKPFEVVTIYEYDPEYNYYEYN